METHQKVLENNLGEGQYGGLEESLVSLEDLKSLEVQMKLSIDHNQVPDSRRREVKYSRSCWRKGSGVPGYSPGSTPTEIHTLGRGGGRGGGGSKGRRETTKNNQSHQHPGGALAAELKYAVLVYIISTFMSSGNML